MIIPDELQVDGDVFARTVAHAGTRGADHELEWPQRALGEALATPAVGYSFVYHVEIGLLFITLVTIGPLVRVTRSTAGVPATRFGLAEFPG